MPAPRNTRAEVRKLHPQWSRRQQARLVVAKLKAARLEQKWGGMVPLTTEQIPRRDTVFTPRTLRESGL